MRRAVAEGLGTAVVVVTACAAAASPSQLAPLAVAAVWGALLVAGRRAGSPGPYFHPALAAAAWVAGRLRSRELGGLLAAHLVGGVLGAAVGARAAGMVAPGRGPVADPAALEAGASVNPQVLLAEAVVVAVLTVVALSATTTGPGAPVGLVAAAAAVLVGPVTGGAFNPTVAAAMAHAGVLPWDLAVAYVPAHLAGALVGALVVRGAPAGLSGGHPTGLSAGLSVRHPTRHPPAATPLPRPRTVAEPVRHGS